MDITLQGDNDKVNIVGNLNQHVCTVSYASGKASISGDNASQCGRVSFNTDPNGRYFINLPASY